jgi:hypothetical protein
MKTAWLLSAEQSGGKACPIVDKPLPSAQPTETLTTMEVAVLASVCRIFVEFDVFEADLALQDDVLELDPVGSRGGVLHLRVLGALETSVDLLPLTAAGLGAGTVDEPAGETAGVAVGLAGVFGERLREVFAIQLLAADGHLRGNVFGKGRDAGEG